MQKKSMFSQEIPAENFGITTEELHWEKVDEGGNFSSEFVNLFRENGILKDTMAGEQYESQKMERGSVK